MNKVVQLEYLAKDGSLVKAIFSPLCGMNLLSLKKNDIEIIDQETTPLFQERLAGLGAMIGPHFHHRNRELIPELTLKSEDFPHLCYVQKNHIAEPFSHGIGRYAPWDYEANPSSIRATLKGTMKWHNYFLKELEGFDFSMLYEAHLTETGLQIDLSISAERPSLMGLHTYYRFQKSSFVCSKVENTYNVKGRFQPLPVEWLNPSHTNLHLPLDQELDFGFLPLDKTKGTILYETKKYSVALTLSSPHEISFQIYKPKESSFVCIEPLSTKNPRDLNRKSSSISITLDIL